MNAFSRYFLQLFSQLWTDIRIFFQGFINVFVELWNNIKNYFDILRANSMDYGLVGWIMVILTNLLLLALFVLFILRIFIWLRKYFRFSKIEMEKEDLMEEIGELNRRTLELIEEKNKIMAMKVSQLGLRPGEEYKEPGKEGAVAGESRFTKLIDVDQQYAEIDTEVPMTEDDLVSLPELVERFICYASTKLKLFYDPKIVAVFICAMATSKLIILEGVSGTGKTSLPYAMSRFFKNNTSIIPVQPSWRERSELLGYLNDFTKKFNETDFLKEVYEVSFRKDINMIVLDEMNLARIEYYFAEFLSIMEIPDPDEWLIDLVPTSLENDPINLRNGKLLIPQNVWFIGTANKDDSTFTITDKVYDRAISIDFKVKNEPFDAPEAEPLNMSYEYLAALFEQARFDYPVSEDLLLREAELEAYIIKNFRLSFGNRIMKQMKEFIPIYVGCGGDEVEALDYLFTYKVLRKFESLNIVYTNQDLRMLIAKMNELFGEGNFAEAITYLTQLQRRG